MVDDDDGRMPDHGHPISSPCEPYGSSEPYGSGELKKSNITIVTSQPNTVSTDL